MNKDDIEQSPGFQSLIDAIARLGEAAQRSGVSMSMFASVAEVANADEVLNSEVILEDILDADYIEE